MYLHILLYSVSIYLYTFLYCFSISVFISVFFVLLFLSALFLYYYYKDNMYSMIFKKILIGLNWSLCLSGDSLCFSFFYFFSLFSTHISLFFLSIYFFSKDLHISLYKDSLMRNIIALKIHMIIILLLLLILIIYIMLSSLLLYYIYLIEKKVISIFLFHIKEYNITYFL